MDDMAKLLYDTQQLMMIRYPRFASEIASAKFSYNKNLKYHTAATDGKNVFFDPEYLASLSESDRLFLIAHELMHIKFAHALRLKDKNGKERDLDVWNIATDAIINANLERDGFTIPKGYINRPEALKYSAEEFYELLLKENKAKEQQENEQQGNGSGQENQVENESEQFCDDHSLWKEAFEKRESEDKLPNNNNHFNNNDEDDNELDKNFNEKEEFSLNREERLTKSKEKFERMKKDALLIQNSSKKTNLGDVGQSADEIDWRYLLRREIDKTETIWSQRRSILENNYAYRLEEYDIEDDAETEAMIDVSGSVDLDLVRAFLRMLKPILKSSKLRVGCFNEKYWGMVEIKKASDIDNFEIPDGARGYYARTEDWNLAVRSFTKKSEINKIVFTDGYPCPGTMPKDDLKNENVIWLVYGNKNFKPCCGKVIQITPKQLKKLQNCQISDEVSIKTR